MSRVQLTRPEGSGFLVLETERGAPCSKNNVALMVQVALFGIGPASTCVEEPSIASAWMSGVRAGAGWDPPPPPPPRAFGLACVLGPVDPEPPPPPPHAASNNVAAHPAARSHLHLVPVSRTTDRPVAPVPSVRLMSSLHPLSVTGESTGMGQPEANAFPGRRQWLRR